MRRFGKQHLALRLKERCHHFLILAESDGLVENHHMYLEGKLQWKSLGLWVFFMVFFLHYANQYEFFSLDFSLFISSTASLRISIRLMSSVIFLSSILLWRPLSFCFPCRLFVFSLAPMLHSFIDLLGIPFRVLLCILLSSLILFSSLPPFPPPFRRKLLSRSNRCVSSYHFSIFYTWLKYTFHFRNAIISCPLHPTHWTHDFHTMCRISTKLKHCIP